MARDIEEFLRKAAERRNRAQQERAPTPQPPSQPPATPRTQFSRPPIEPRRSVEEDDEEVLVPEIVEERESVKDHVRRHINTKEIVEHVAHLGEEVALADDKLEARLHQTFDHDVGKLAHSTDPYTDQKAQSQNDFMRFLRNPKTVRQAIVVSEILKRPEW
jgi:hypothetical protein